jgi:RNA-directed DNA polymerase
VQLMDEVASEAVLDLAYAWLCQRRRAFLPDADVWALRHHWPRAKPQLRAELRAGTYRCALLSRVTFASGEEIDLWAARDALVLKAVALVLAQRLPLSPRCAHLKGHGGSKGALREVLRHLDANRFVLRTDIRLYYASIEHDLILDRLAGCIQDRRVLNLVAQYLKRTAERGGLFWDYPMGIALGCPLSPLIGAFFLRDLDLALERLGLFFVRFMDDVLVLAPTRGKLRRAVQVVNRTLVGLHLEKHPTKTFIGRIDKALTFWAITWRRAGWCRPRGRLRHS